MRDQVIYKAVDRLLSYFSIILKTSIEFDWLVLEVAPHSEAFSVLLSLNTSIIIEKLHVDCWYIRHLLEIQVNSV